DRGRRSARGPHLQGRQPRLPQRHHPALRRGGGQGSVGAGDRLAEQISARVGEFITYGALTASTAEVDILQRAGSKCFNRLQGPSALLKGARPIPIRVRLAFRTALALPQRISAFAEALMLRLAPEVVGATLRTPRLVPEKIGAVANELV